MAVEQYDIAEHMNVDAIAKAFLAKMYKELHGIRQALDVDAIPIDEWKWEQSATVIQPLPEYDGPIVITSILAVYPAQTTSASISLGRPDRIIPLNPNPTTGGSNTGSPVTAPAAGTTIATVTGLPAGTYTVNWDVTLGGTPGAGEVNNFILTVNGVTQETSINAGAVGTYPQASAQVTIPAGGGNVSIKNSGIGTAGAIYDAQLSVVGQSLGVQPTVFNITDLRMKIGQRDGARNLTIAPAGAAYVNFFGYADKKVVDRL